ncbi:hypothetical protein GCM10009788_36380 [Nocardioides humi]|uniref:Uncharacterized protein n=1 Tax=Nocardioides humi TaxID=449461 RepID=A0ABN2AXP2_9ACTN
MPQSRVAPVIGLSAARAGDAPVARRPSTTPAAVAAAIRRPGRVRRVVAREGSGGAHERRLVAVIGGDLLGTDRTVVRAGPPERPLIRFGKPKLAHQRSS